MGVSGQFIPKQKKIPIPMQQDIKWYLRPSNDQRREVSIVPNRKCNPLDIPHSLVMNLTSFLWLPLCVTKAKGNILGCISVHTGKSFVSGYWALQMWNYFRIKVHLVSNVKKVFRYVTPSAIEPTWGTFTRTMLLPNFLLSRWEALCSFQ